MLGRVHGPPEPLSSAISSNKPLVFLGSAAHFFFFSHQTLLFFFFSFLFISNKVEMKLKRAEINPFVARSMARGFEWVQLEDIWKTLEKRKSSSTITSAAAEMWSRFSYALSSLPFRPFRRWIMPFIVVKAFSRPPSVGSQGLQMPLKYWRKRKSFILSAITVPLLQSRSPRRDRLPGACKLLLTPASLLASDV